MATERGAFVIFENASDGGTARVEAFANGSLNLFDRSSPTVTTGSLEGDGNVSLGSYTPAIGSNNFSTIFLGLIQDTCSLSKVGAGVLTLSGANTYSGGTTIESGKLIINNPEGSGTGTGPVQANGGQLRGQGTIRGGRDYRHQRLSHPGEDLVENQYTYHPRQPYCQCGRRL